jgi:hypothetical protein
MSQVRVQPLPVGRYWIIVTDALTSTLPGGSSRVLQFRAWAASNPTRVRVEHSDSSDLTVDGAFFIFSILQPTRFDQRSFGFPNTAGPEVQTSADTVQRPPVPTPLSTLEDWISDLTQSVGGRFAIVAGLVYLASKMED